MARTLKSARQLITHKKVLVEGRVINAPSYLVPINLENKISLKDSKNVKKEVVENNKEEESE